MPTKPQVSTKSQSWAIASEAMLGTFFDCFLAPDIQQAILAGRQPATLTLTALTETELPLLWTEQRRMLGLDPPLGTTDTCGLRTLSGIR
jgi:hypothetical protein